MPPGVRVSGMPFPAYNGAYSVDGVQPLANGRTHYSNSASHHMYKQRGTWLINKSFKPHLHFGRRVVEIPGCMAALCGRGKTFPLGTHEWDVLVAKDVWELRPLRLELLRGEEAKLVESLESTAGLLAVAEKEV